MTCYKAFIFLSIALLYGMGVFYLMEINAAIDAEDEFQMQHDRKGGL